MHRYKLIIEYDGRPFVGWQRQDNGPTVQQALEEAAGRVFSGDVSTIAAGRTDAGVHALGMCVHLDGAKEFSPFRLREAINFHLKPTPIAVLDVEEVSPEFHARFSATARHYRYRFINRRAPLALEKGKAWGIGVPLDAGLMNEAAQVLVGKHDFTTFRAAQCQSASPVKSLSSIAVNRNADAVNIEVSAPSFLHHQVRSIAGSLVEVGKGHQPVGWIADILAAKDRHLCGMVAPAHGLYFLSADYPEDAG